MKLGPDVSKWTEVRKGGETKEGSGGAGGSWAFWMAKNNRHFQAVSGSRECRLSVRIETCIPDLVFILLGSLSRSDCFPLHFLSPALGGSPYARPPHPTPSPQPSLTLLSLSPPRAWHRNVTPVTITHRCQNKRGTCFGVEEWETFGASSKFIHHNPTVVLLRRNRLLLCSNGLLKVNKIVE